MVLEVLGQVGPRLVGSQGEDGRQLVTDPRHDELKGVLDGAVGRQLEDEMAQSALRVSRPDGVEAGDQSGTAREGEAEPVPRPVDGRLSVPGRAPQPDRYAAVAADEPTTAYWLARLARVSALAAAKMSR